MITQKEHVCTVFYSVVYISCCSCSRISQLASSPKYGGYKVLPKWFFSNVQLSQLCWELGLLNIRDDNIGKPSYHELTKKIFIGGPKLVVLPNLKMYPEQLFFVILSKRNIRLFKCLYHISKWQMQVEKLNYEK